MIWRFFTKRIVAQFPILNNNGYSALKQNKITIFRNFQSLAYRFNENKQCELLTADRSCTTKYFWKNSDRSLYSTSLHFFYHILRPNWSIIRGTVSLWSMFGNRQIAAIEGKCRWFLNSSECLKNHYAANDWQFFCKTQATFSTVACNEMTHFRSNYSCETLNKM